MSEPIYSPLGRAERLIAGARVVLATVSFFAVWLDPTEPSKHAEIAYTLLGAYLLLAVVIALLLWRSLVPAPRQRMLTHVFDLAFFSLFIYFTSGPSSPFIAFFVFSMVCATLRWQWRGAVWTAVAALTSFLGLGIYFATVQDDPAFHVHPFVIRASYLTVMAVLLAYLGAHEQRVRTETWKLAAWPQARAMDGPSLVRELLSYARECVGVRRAAMIWTEGEEPGAFFTEWNEAGFHWSRLPPGDLQPFVAAPLGESSFFLTSLQAPESTVVVRSATGVETWRGAPLHPALAERLRTSTVLSVSISGGTVEGRLFFLDKPKTTSDDLALASIVGSVVSARLNQHYLVERLEQTAATEERIRLARDLHDGVLQSLTGVALRLAAVQRQIDGAPAHLKKGLEDIRRIITLEQRDLRFFVQDLTPRGRWSDGSTTLRERLRELVDRVEGEWNLRVQVSEENGCRPVAGEIAREACLIVREALVNAVRHGEASEVRVRLDDAGDDRFAVSIRDNGKGFSFRGSYRLEDLIAKDLGPRSLRERVRVLGGSLTLESNPTGVRLDILLPRSGAGD